MIAMKLIVRLLGALILGLTASLAQADQIPIAPFARGTLSLEQRALWQQYIALESGAHGCQYGDDPRLFDDPRQLLHDLAAGDDIAPVKITLRSYLIAPEPVRELLSRNMVLESLDCQPSYVWNGDIIGYPVLPFEEYADLLSRLKEQDRIPDIVLMVKHAQIGTLDPRLMRAFFVVQDKYFDRLGIDPETIRWATRAFDKTFDPAGPALALPALFSRAPNRGTGLDSYSCRPAPRGWPAERFDVQKEIPNRVIHQAFNLMGADLVDAPLDYRGEEIDVPALPWLNLKLYATALPTECIQ